jgi:hypothetical protein
MVLIVIIKSGGADIRILPDLWAIMPIPATINSRESYAEGDD